MGFRLYLDIETLDFFGDGAFSILPRDIQLIGFRFGLAVSYDDELDQWRRWDSGSSLDLLHACFAAGQVVGFNIRRFDLPVLWRHVKPLDFPVSSFSLVYSRCFDLFDLLQSITKRYYSLRVLAEVNLGRTKGDFNGRDAATRLATGDPVLIESVYNYCQTDVELIIDLVSLLESGGTLVLPPLQRSGMLDELELVYAPRHPSGPTWLLSNRSYPSLLPTPFPASQYGLLPSSGPF